MTRLEEIIRTTRATGNTTWILQSAIERPNCIIVSRTMQQAKHLEQAYKSLLSKSAWYKKLWWKWFGRKSPKFVSLDFRFEGYRLPVIFDNGALF
jgi:hypothetical protein